MLYVHKYIEKHMEIRRDPVVLERLVTTSPAYQADALLTQLQIKPTGCSKSFYISFASIFVLLTYL